MEEKNEYIMVFCCQSYDYDVKFYTNVFCELIGKLTIERLLNIQKQITQEIQEELEIDDDEVEVVIINVVKL